MSLDTQNLPENREASLKGSEVWRLQESSHGETDSCDLCRTINLSYLFPVSSKTRLKDNKDEVILGYLEDIMTRKRCSFCRLIVRSLQAFTGLEELPTHSDTVKIKCFLRQKELVVGKSSLFRTIAVVTFPPLPAVVEESNDFNGAARPYLNEPSISVAEDEEDPDYVHPSYLLPEWVDFRRIKLWLNDRNCNCSIITPAILPANFRLIDVENGCIVTDLDSDVRYVTLSYTWGQLQRPFLRTLKSNLGELSIPGGLRLDDERIPHTIRDAMVVTKEVGEKYIWVDSLCIVQDDDVDKGQQIGAMAEIYSSSIFTIMTTFGSDADSGLPGVFPTTRSNQIREKVRGITLATIQPDVRLELDSSNWNTRGWTFQERVLSRRLLVFCSSQVHLSCIHNRDKREEFAEEWYIPARPNSIDIPSKFPGFRDYSLAVAHYSQRQLGFNTDVLKAISAVTDLLRPKFRGGYALGLPESHFDMALLWYTNKVVSRRYFPGTSDPILPTWTWAAWLGDVAYAYYRGHSSRLSSRLLFRNWREDCAGTICAQDLLPTESWPYLKNWSRDDMKEYTYWKDKPAEEGHSHEFPILPENERPKVDYCDPNTGYLEFWTQAAYFGLSDQAIPEALFSLPTTGEVTYIPEVWRTITNDHNKVVGCVNLNVDPSTGVLDSSRLPFIILSRTTLQHGYSNGPADDHFASSSDESVPWDVRQFNYDAESLDEEAGGSWNVYNVMLLDTLDGTSSRLGIGRIWLVDFHEVNPQRVQITLG